MLIASQGHSQSSKDSSKIATKDALKVLAKGYEARALEQQRDLLLIGTDTLKARIAIKDMQIVNLKADISDYKNIISSKDAIISTQGEQRKIFEADVLSLTKQVKKQTRAKKLTAFLGLLVSGGLAYLYITK